MSNKLGRPFSEVTRDIKTTIRLTKEEKEKLDKLAIKENTKVAYIIRRAINNELKKIK